MSSIPQIDISAFTSGSDSEARRITAREVASVLGEYGCAAITGHGVPEEILRELLDTAKKFFDLPLAEKMKAPHPDGPVPHRGYLAKTIEKSGKLGAVHSRSAEEKAFLANAVDWKETYDIGHEDNDSQKNIWLPENVLCGFKPYMLQIYERFSNVSLAILEALMLGMELSDADSETMRKIHHPIDHQLRLAHYLPMSLDVQRDPNKIRLAPHKDFASYTLLFQDSKSGLEFQNRRTQEYMPATPREGVLYLNIGDLFERFSNGFYPSAMHRVAIPSAQDSNGTIPGRYSIPYFTHIDLQQLIYPMPSRVEADGVSKFEAIRYEDLATKLFNPVMAPST